MGEEGEAEGAAVEGGVVVLLGVIDLVVAVE